MSSGGGAAAKPKEEEQDGMSVHSPCKPPPSSASSLPKVSSLSNFQFQFILILI
jgi:MRG-binding protein